MLISTVTITDLSWVETTVQHSWMRKPRRCYDVTATLDTGEQLLAARFVSRVRVQEFVRDGWRHFIVYLADSGHPGHPTEPRLGFEATKNNPLRIAVRIDETV